MEFASIMESLYFCCCFLLLLLLVFKKTQDAPRDAPNPVTVTPSKAGQRSDCLKCHYIHRGSFKEETLNSLVAKVEQNPPLADKCLGMHLGMEWWDSMGSTVCA